jgi:hypothetical protein
MAEPSRDLTTLPAGELVAALHPTGEWTDQHSRAAAHQIAELVSYLNHATQPMYVADQSIPTPNTAADVIDALRTAVQRLPQLLGQLAYRQLELAEHPAIAARNGDPQTLVPRASTHLYEAASLIQQATTPLGEARTAAADLYLDISHDR